MASAGPDSLGSRIADALGLKHCRRLTLHFEVDCLATVEAECWLFDDDGRVADCIGKKYTLVEEGEYTPPQEPVIHAITQGR